MGQGVIHGNHNIKAFQKGLRQGTEIGVFKPDLYIVLRRALFCLGKLAVTDVRRGDSISQRRKADGLGADAAGTIQHAGRGVKSRLSKEAVQNDRLLLCGGLPVGKELIVLGGQRIVKSLCDVHRTFSFYRMLKNRLPLSHVAFSTSSAVSPLI